jgi:hypothetical protein
VRSQQGVPAKGRLSGILFGASIIHMRAALARSKGTTHGDCTVVWVSGDSIASHQHVSIHIYWGRFVAFVAFVAFGVSCYVGVPCWCLDGTGTGVASIRV